MAITHVEFALLSMLRRSGALSSRPKVLELGKSNWYGDVPPAELAKAVGEFAAGESRQSLLEEIDRLAANQDGEISLYGLAELFFRIVLNYASLSAIDIAVPHSTYQFDLNQPVALNDRFDVVLNSGTAEHVFNTHQFFKTVHELTAAEGVMVHGAPFTGWIEHGFYNFQPTFFLDLAASNGYQILIALCSQIRPQKIVQLQSRDHILELARADQFSGNSMLYFVFRKPAESREFQTPMQAFYAKSLSSKLTDAWRTLR